MVRKLLLTAAAATMAAAPIAAQAAPARTPAPVSSESENLAGGILIPVAVFAVLAALLAFAWDDDDDEVPVSP